MITAGSENKELAHKFLEYMIEAKTQKLVTDKTHYVPANPQAAVHDAGEVKRCTWTMSRATEASEFLAERARRAKYTEFGTT